MRDIAVTAAKALPIGNWMPGRGARGVSGAADQLVPLAWSILKENEIDPKDIGSVVFSAVSTTTAQLGLPVHVCSRLGLAPRGGQISETAAMGITGGNAFDMAAMDVATGRTDAALVFGLCHQTHESGRAAMERGIRITGDVEFHAPFGLIPISWYALDAARYLYETGRSREDLASVAVKSRQWSKNNALAQFRTPLTVDEVLRADPIVEPLGLLDIPARADGAIVLLVEPEENAHGRPHLKRIGRGFAHDGYHQVGQRPHDMTDFPAARHAVNDALSSAKASLNDIDLFELYSPCTITEIMVSEAIGLFTRGEGAAAAREGRTAPGGDMPLNTSGGCLARGHPPTITALYDILHMFDHQTGQQPITGYDHDASLSLTLCEMGNYNAAMALIFETGN